MTIFEINIFWLHIAPSYYGLMYVWGFIAGYYYFIYKKILSSTQLDSLFFYIFLWVVLGWRLWYIIFYNPEYYFLNPIEILKVWEWGMSFHGGMLGVLIASLIFCKKYKILYWKLVDELALIVTIGIWLWRIWNYLNKELLWYAGYTWPFAVIVDGVSYFPSPLLEALLEWFVLFIILWFINKYKHFYGKTAAYFGILYWIFRIFIEIFFRTPDEHIGYIYGVFTLWIVYSIPMILIGIWLLIIGKKKYALNK